MADAHVVTFKQFDEQVSAGKKPSEKDCEFLEHDSEHRRYNSCAEGDDKYDILRLAMNYLSCYVITEDEPDTTQEQPVDSSTHREQGDTQQQSEDVHDNTSLAVNPEFRAKNYQNSISR